MLQRRHCFARQSDAAPASRTSVACGSQQAHGPRVLAASQAQAAFRAPVVLGSRRSCRLQCAPPDAPSPPPFTTVPDEVVDVRQPSPATLPRPLQATEQQSCDFYSHWWPVLPEVDLDSSRPTPVNVLGMQLVVWCDSKGQWQCFQDRCPHRLAPLSEGVVQGDNLMCTYHGWQFGQGGKCQSIPQIEDAKAHATAVASPRNCVQTYPVKMFQGLLWVYPKPGATGAAEAITQPVPSMAIQTLLQGPQGESSKFFQATGWYMRELPLRFETLMENLLDLGHVPFAHHNAAGISKNKVVNPTLSVPAYGHISPEGFAITRPAVPAHKAAEYDLKLKAPAHVSYEYKEGGTIFNQHFIVTPTRPGWSMLFTSLAGPKDAKLPRPIRILSKLIAKFPALEHVLLRHEVLDGDTFLLHVAERGLLAAGNDPRAYYMPGNSDLPVVMWRKWLHKHAPVVPTCTKADDARMPPTMPREQVLNRYEQHTRHCKACQATLKAVDQGQLVSQVLGALAVLVTVPAVVARVWPLLSWQAAVGVLVAALSGAVYRALKAFKPHFFFTDYQHVERYAKK